jgi:hypothetical protein
MENYLTRSSFGGLGGFVIFRLVGSNLIVGSNQRTLGCFIFTTEVFRK